MKTLPSLVGQTFGRLTVTAQFKSPTDRRTKCSYKCACGNVGETDHRAIVHGYTRSCGCLRDDRRRARASTGLFMGKRHTAATRRRMSESKPKRPIVGVNLRNPEDVVFCEGVRDAERRGFGASGNISRALLHPTRTSNGYRWAYLEELDIDTISEAMLNIAQMPSVARPKHPRNPKGGPGKPVVLTAPDGTETRYPSAAAASRALGMLDYHVASAINMNCRCKGFRPRYEAV